MGDGKRRHGCLTTWLLLMVVGYGVIAILWSLFWVIGSDIGSSPEWRGLPHWRFPVSIAVSLFNVACAVALLRWKKWGFWGFLVSSVVLAMVNFSLGWILGVVAGFVELAVFCGLLHIGKENKGWPQLD